MSVTVCVLWGADAKMESGVQKEEGGGVWQSLSAPRQSWSESCPVLDSGVQALRVALLSRCQGSPGNLCRSWGRPCGVPWFIVRSVYLVSFPFLAEVLKSLEFPKRQLQWSVFWNVNEVTSGHTGGQGWLPDWFQSMRMQGWRFRARCLTSWQGSGIWQM